MRLRHGAETDVINMVSRGIATPDVLKSIHLSMASRIVKLLKVAGIKQGTALITGGLALDSGLLAAIQEEMVNEKIGVTAISHPDSIYAGAIGAALWGYAIDPFRCTECVGAEEEPQCKLVCPADCVVMNPDFEESPEQLVRRQASRSHRACARDGSARRPGPTRYASRAIRWHRPVWSA